MSLTLDQVSVIPCTILILSREEEIEDRDGDTDDDSNRWFLFTNDNVCLGRKLSLDNILSIVFEQNKKKKNLISLFLYSYLQVQRKLKQLKN